MPSNFRANPNLDKISITSCCDAQYGKFFFFNWIAHFQEIKLCTKLPVIFPFFRKQKLFINTLQILVTLGNQSTKK